MGICICIILILNAVTIVWQPNPTDKEDYFVYTMIVSAVTMMICLVIQFPISVHMEEQTIIKYCNGDIKIDTLAVTQDGKLFEIKMHN